MSRDLSQRRRGPFGKPAWPRARFLLIGARGLRAVDTGQKTALVVPVALTPIVTEFSRGQILDLHWVRDPSVWRRTAVERVCRHRKLDSIPTCRRGHDPARIDSEHPDWATILEAAASGGDASIRDTRRQARASQGFVVVEFDRVADGVTGSDSALP